MFQYAPEVNFVGHYSLGSTFFLDQGGRDSNQAAGIRGVYRWQDKHNLHAGYTSGLIKSRNGEDNVVHNFDFGDDYLTSYDFKLDPTLTLSGSTGISFTTGNKGPRIANNSTTSVTKVWETASFVAGLRRGLSESFGVAGLSLTTSLFSAFNIRLTERLAGSAGVDFSLFDTDRVDFNVFQAHAGLQYPITSWLTSSLRYSHRWRKGGGELGGKVTGNSILATFTFLFDIWPRVSFSEGLSSSSSRLPISP
jgi:hypothetical protein